MHKYTHTNRVTVDIDEPDTNKLEYIVNKAISILDYDRIEVFQSASGNGFHVYAYLNKNISYDKQFRYRKQLDDCKIRLMLSKKDLAKGFNPDVMFQYKKINGEWKKEKYLFTINDNDDYKKAYFAKWLMLRC